MTRLLGAEERFVLAASRADLEPDYADELHEMLAPRSGTRIDFDKVFAIAHHQRVVPICAHNLDVTGCIETIPTGVMKEFASAAQRNAKRNEILHEQAVVIASHAYQRGVPILFRKGLPLATMGYGDRSLRSMGDIDLLVERAHVRDLMASLRSDGLHSEMSTEAQRLLLLGGLNYPAFSKHLGRDECPELHVGISTAYFERSAGFAYDISDVFDRSVRHGEGDDMRIADPADFLIDVCAHFTKDAKSLASIELGTDLLLYRFCDVARLARATKRLGAWHECRRRVVAAGISPPVHFALWYASQADPGSSPPDAESLRGNGSEQYLHSYGETERAVGRWTDGGDVLGRVFDVTRSSEFRGSSRWAAVIESELTD